MASLVIQDAFDPYYAGKGRLGSKTCEQFSRKPQDPEKPDSASRLSDSVEREERTSEH